MIKWQHCREIKTYDIKHIQNGSIIELFKDKTKTNVYITIIKPGVFKGYHIHSKRTNKFTCIKGDIVIHHKEKAKRKGIITLNDSILERVVIPPNVLIGIENIGKTDAWLLNYPNPSYDPNDNEQTSVERSTVEKT